jgi:hypothetical protein
VVFRGNGTDNWRTVVLAFPFESVKDNAVRDDIMQKVLDFLFK